MRDADLRAAMVIGVAKRMGVRSHLLVPEVDIRWSIPARIDALLVADRITGFEIKSEADSLARLPRQIEAYGAVVERAVLVSAPRHLDAGLRLVPEWWSVWVARTTHGEIRLRRVRGGTLNPEINPLAVLTFMSREAITSALRELGYGNLSGMSVDELRSKLFGAVPRTQLMRIARTAMLGRADWRSRSLLPRTTLTTVHDVKSPRARSTMVPQLPTPFPAAAQRVGSPAGSPQARNDVR